MPHDPTAGKAEHDAILELVDHSKGRARAELHEALSADFTADQVDVAVASLESVGLVRSTPARVYASDGLQRLDELGMIAV
jgi:hypothetical protein